MTNTLDPETVSQPGAGHRTRTRAFAVVGAAVAALIVWIVAVPVLDVDLRATLSNSVQTIGVALVLITALLSSLLGWGLLALLERFVSRARTAWTAVAVVALFLSFVNPLSYGATTAAKVTLVLMHVAVAAVLIPMLWRTSPAR